MLGIVSVRVSTSSTFTELCVQKVTLLFAPDISIEFSQLKSFIETKITKKLVIFYMIYSYVEYLISLVTFYI